MKKKKRNEKNTKNREQKTSRKVWEMAVFSINLINTSISH